MPHFHGGELSGSVEVAGTDALEAGPAVLAAAVGYVAQDPEAQVVSTTVAAEIELPLELGGEAPAARSRAVEEVALALAIPHLLGRTVDTLSGGELQRVALAAALVTRPSLVLLDEPTSQLDPVAGDELVWLLRRLNEEWGVAVLLAEHRLERCLAAADRVIAMDCRRDRLRRRAGGFPRLGHRHRANARHARRPGCSRSPGSSRFPSAFATLARSLRRRPGLGGAGPPAHSHSRRGVDGEKSGVSGRSRAKRSQGAPAPRGSARRCGEDLWVELDAGDRPRDVLRGVDLSVQPGERIALMGRNGAGKSTLLRTLAGLVEPVRGEVEVARRDGAAHPEPRRLPGSRAGRRRAAGRGGSRRRLPWSGLEHAVDADPRDLSGGERQRLALAIALAGRLDGAAIGGLVALDEPTRGMDRARQDDLVGLIEAMASRGAAVLVATHDVEFAACFAERVVLLGDGVVIADGAVEEILSGGWYFATEVARVLDLPGVITPQQGAAALAEGGR